MSKKITVATQKGGNGKTSIILNMSYELSKQGKEVLIIDEDPQASISKNLLGEEELASYPGLEDLLLNTSLDPSEYIQKTKMDNVSVLPCHPSIEGTSAKLIYDGDGFFSLKEVLKKIDGYDYIFIDTPGNLGFLTLSSFIAADHLLIPVYPAYYSLFAINDLISKVETMKKNFNADIDILGVVVTMIDRRANLYKEIEEQVRDFFGQKVFDTTTTRTVRSEEATLNSIGVSGLHPDCKLALEYQNLSKELLKRLHSDDITPDHLLSGLDELTD